MKFPAPCSKSNSKVEVLMMPLIDIVFQLLAFFLMTFQLAPTEGDFSIRMPLASREKHAPDIDLLPPIKIRLSYADGKLGLALAQRTLPGYSELRREVQGLLAQAGPGAESVEVELDCDYDLPYNHVVETLTHVTGTVQQGRVVRLIERVKFSPPRGP